MKNKVSEFIFKLELGPVVNKIELHIFLLLNFFEVI